MSDFKSADCRVEKKKRSNLLGRSRKGCLTCRKKHVRCDEKRPECGRCSRLHLSCILPSVEVKKFQGAMAPHSKPRSLKPRVAGTKEHDDNDSGTSSSQPSGNSAFPHPIINGLTERFMGDHMEMFSIDTSHFQELPREPSPVLQNYLSNTSIDIISQSNDALFDLHLSFLHPIPTSISQKSWPGSLVLGPDDQVALKYYRTSFALSQTLKDPDWSLPSLILHLISKNKIAMHLALAVSFQHMSDSQYASQCTLHFQEGFDLFCVALLEGNEKDKVSILASFYFLFVFTLSESNINLERTKNLSIWALNYIQKFQLDSLGFGFTRGGHDGLEHKTEEIGDKDPESLTVVARLILWLYKEDIRSVAMGGPGYLGKHFQRNPEEMMNIWRFSRPALQLHWGMLYPLSQSLDDIQMSQAVDMGVELLFLRYEVTACWSSSVDFAREALIESSFRQVTMKYDLIFQVAAATFALSRNLHSYSCIIVATFYALKLTFLRTRSTDTSALEYLNLENSLLAAIQSVLNFEEVITYEGTQWVLFLASIGIYSIEHHGWLTNHIKITRYKHAAQKILGHRRANVRVGSLQSVLADG